MGLLLAKIRLRFERRENLFSPSDPAWTFKNGVQASRAGQCRRQSSLAKCQGIGVGLVTAD